jgi:hypothetical protein
LESDWEIAGNPQFSVRPDEFVVMGIDEAKRAYHLAEARAKTSQMESPMNTPTNFRRIVRNATLGLGLAAVIGGIGMAPAMAGDYYGHRDAYSHYDHRDTRGYAYREHAYREHERFAPRYAYAAPRYDYAAPGYRYYAPAPAYVAPSVNLGFTIR